MTSQAFVSGHLGKEPELRYLPNGKPVASFSVASTRRWQNRQTSEWEEKTSWIDVECWNELADHVSESLERGSAVVVTGRMEQQSWEQSDGTKRSKIILVADDVGASLKKATVAITKVQRTSPNDDGGQHQSNTAQQSDYDPNSEPF